MNVLNIMYTVKLNIDKLLHKGEEQMLVTWVTIRFTLHCGYPLQQLYIGTCKLHSVPYTIYSCVPRIAHMISHLCLTGMKYTYLRVEYIGA